MSETKTPSGGAELRKSGVGNNAKPKASTRGPVGRDTALRQSDPGPANKMFGDHHKQTGYKRNGVL